MSTKAKKPVEVPEEPEVDDEDDGVKIVNAEAKSEKNPWVVRVVASPQRYGGTHCEPGTPVRIRKRQADPLRALGRLLDPELDGEKIEAAEEWADRRKKQFKEREARAKVRMVAVPGGVGSPASGPSAEDIQSIVGQALKEQAATYDAALAKQAEGFNAQIAELKKAGGAGATS